MAVGKVIKIDKDYLLVEDKNGSQTWVPKETCALLDCRELKRGCKVVFDEF